MNDVSFHNGFQRLLRGHIPLFLQPEEIRPQPPVDFFTAVPSTPPMGFSSPSPFDSPTVQDANFLKGVQGDLQRDIYTIEPENRKRLNEINEERRKDGKPPIDFFQTTREIESIMDDPSLKDDEKDKKIGEIRDRLGLGKKDMKNLFTQRLSEKYDKAKDKIEAYKNNLKKAAENAEKIYGKESPEAQIARARVELTKITLDPTYENYKAKADHYDSLFPSFWRKFKGAFKKIGGFFKKVGQGFAKVMNFVSPFLRFVPGIGQMVSFGWSALKGVVQAIQGNWKGILGGALDFAKGIPGVGPLLSTASSFASKALSWAKPVWDTAHGNLSSLLHAGLSWAGRLPFVEGAITQTQEYLSRLLSPLKPVTIPIQPILEPLEKEARPLLKF
ncbi:MAG: hypothetical protein U1F57_06030 [bacterium]